MDMTGTRERKLLVFDGFGTVWGFVESDEFTFLLRPHAREVLTALAAEYDLVLWTTAPQERFDLVTGQHPVLLDLFNRIITRETAPTTEDTFFTEQPRAERISKNAVREGAAFGFPVLRPPSFSGATAADLPRLAADDWLLGLPQRLAELWRSLPCSAPDADPAATAAHQ
ncbi:MAG: hypothetical protein NTZ05_04370 [Chloroflexi bacterium]|nr:hypothetical protein [Chloroflexota bacterium]